MTAHKLEYYVAHPESSHPAKDAPLPKGVGLLLGTPVASHVFKDGDKLDGDTGRRAQFLADALGVKVLAWQDLGPKVRFPEVRAARHRLTADNFTEFAQENAAHLAGALHGHDIGQAIMRVHSGTGPVGSQLAIELHKQPDTEVSHLAISDPVGMINTSFLGGAYKYFRYNLSVAKNTPAEHRNHPSTAPNTFRSLVADIAVRGTTTWLTDVTYRNLLHIGNHQPDMAVNLHIPGNTFNGTPDEARLLADNLQSQVHRENNTFVAAYEPDDYHSSAYDNLSRNVAFIEQTIGLDPFV
jgi:hypothetical protein